MPIDTPHTLFVDGSPTRALLELLQECDISHDGTLADIVAKTQASWIRKAGSERWDIEQKKAGNSKKIVSLLQELGCVQATYPTKKHYDTVIIFGGTFGNMLKRFAYAYSLLQNGTITAKQIVFLVGQRPTNQAVESHEKIRAATDQFRMILPLRIGYGSGIQSATETDLAKRLCEQLLLPNGFPPITFIDTPMQGTAQAPRRPQTADTIVRWLTTESPEGTYLFISSNPHVWYQHAVAERVVSQHQDLVPSTFNFETIGPAADPDENIGIYLDAIARWLYEANLASSGK